SVTLLTLSWKIHLKLTRIMERGLLCWELQGGGECGITTKGLISTLERSTHGSAFPLQQNPESGRTHRQRS
ncbi:hypothetical protein AMECASPLE_024555, partial [Ameca splendens]